METLPPTPESNELPPTREELIESLKNNPENLEPLHRFLKAREARLEYSKDSTDDFGPNIKLAEIYRDAGLIEAAYDAFHQVYEQVAYDSKPFEGKDELAQKLLAEHKRLAKLLPPL